MPNGKSVEFASGQVGFALDNEDEVGDDSEFLIERGVKAMREIAESVVLVVGSGEDGVRRRVREVRKELRGDEMLVGVVIEDFKRPLAGNIEEGGQCGGKSTEACLAADALAELLAGEGRSRLKSAVAATLDRIGSEKVLVGGGDGALRVNPKLVRLLKGAEEIAEVDAASGRTLWGGADDGRRITLTRYLDKTFQVKDKLLASFFSGVLSWKERLLNATVETTTTTTTTTGITTSTTTTTTTEMPGTSSKDVTDEDSVIFPSAILEDSTDYCHLPGMDRVCVMLATGSIGTNFLHS